MTKPRQASANPNDADDWGDAKKAAGGKKQAESGQSNGASPIDFTKPPFLVAYALVGLVITVFAVKWLFFAGPSGPALTRVTGTVTMDGKPVAGADVTFHPASKQGDTAYARTDRLGHFDVKTGGTGRGVLMDDYRVTVTKYASEEKLVSPDEAKKVLPKDGKAPPPPKLTNAVPEIYASVQKTPVTVSVKSRRPVRLPIDLK
jgi:hypothetical protein